MSWVTKTIVLRISRLQAQELVLQALAVDRVDRAERLVHEHQRRVGGQGAGDADALALAAGELRRVARAHRRGSRPMSSSSSSTRARMRCARSQPSSARDGGDVLARSSGAGRGRSAGSRSRCRAAARPGWRSRTDRPSSRMSPLGDLDHAVDQAHRRRLAAARGPDEDADVAGGDLEARACRSPARSARGSVFVTSRNSSVAACGCDDGPSAWAVSGRSRRRIPRARARRRVLVAPSRTSDGPLRAGRSRVRRVLEARRRAAPASSSAPVPVAISQSANQAFLGSSGPCR